MIIFNFYTLLNGISGINLISIALYGLFNKQQRNSSTTIFLSLFCVFLSLNFLSDILILNQIFGAYMRYLDELSLLLAFPSLYFYVLLLTKNRLTFKWQYLLHGLPILFFLLVWVFPPHSFISWNRAGAMNTFYRYYNHLQFLFYIITIFRLLQKNDQISPELIAGMDSSNLSWIKQLLMVMFILFTVWVLNDAHLINGDLINYLILLFSYWLGYHAIRQKNIYDNLSPDFQMESVAPGQNRYKNSKLTENHKKSYAARIKELMIHEKPYLNNELTLTSLADKLDLKPIYVSQVLNEEFQENFYAFINRYRIEESQRLLKDKRYENYSIHAIALEAGFNSKSTFNKAFREIAGISPSEYQKRA